MAYLVRRPSGAFQIRESVRTPDGPRSRTLASFRGALDDAVLAEAERRALKPFDRRRLVERARARGLVCRSATAGAARRLVHGLRRGVRIDPALRRVLRAELDGPGASGALPEEFEEAAEWIGASPEERAASLRGLLRLGDAIARSRGRSPSPPGVPYPVIHSGPDADARDRPEGDGR